MTCRILIRTSYIVNRTLQLGTFPVHIQLMRYVKKRKSNSLSLQRVLNIKKNPKENAKNKTGLPTGNR